MHKDIQKSFQGLFACKAEISRSNVITVQPATIKDKNSKLCDAINLTYLHGVVTCADCWYYMRVIQQTPARESAYRSQKAFQKKFRAASSVFHYLWSSQCPTLKSQNMLLAIYITKLIVRKCKWQRCDWQKAAQSRDDGLSFSSLVRSR